MKKEPWVEKPEWQALRRQGAIVIALQHYHSDKCTVETCAETRHIALRNRIRELELAGYKLVYCPTTFEWKVVPI